MQPMKDPWQVAKFEAPIPFVRRGGCPFTHAKRPLVPGEYGVFPHGRIVQHVREPEATAGRRKGRAVMPIVGSKMILNVQ